MWKVFGLAACVVGFGALIVSAVVRARRDFRRRRLISHIRAHAPTRVMSGQLWYELTEEQARELGFQDDTAVADARRAAGSDR